MERIAFFFKGEKEMKLKNKLENFLMDYGEIIYFLFLAFVGTIFYFAIWRRDIMIDSMASILITLWIFFQLYKTGLFGGDY